MFTKSSPMWTFVTCQYKNYFFIVFFTTTVRIWSRTIPNNNGRNIILNKFVTIVNSVKDIDVNSSDKNLKIKFRVCDKAIILLWNISCERVFIVKDWMHLTKNLKSHVWYTSITVVAYFVNNPLLSLVNLKSEITTGLTLKYAGGYFRMNRFSTGNCCNNQFIIIILYLICFCKRNITAENQFSITADI